MSGIYIPGMEMPKEKDVLTIAIQSDGEVLSIGFDNTLAGGIFLSHPNTFPIRAIPVPDHGRLIDADNLDYITVSIDKRGCVSKIDAPTIIPADKDGAE